MRKTRTKSNTIHLRPNTPKPMHAYRISNNLPFRLFRPFRVALLLLALFLLFLSLLFLLFSQRWLPRPEQLCLDPWQLVPHTSVVQSDL